MIRSPYVADVLLEGGEEALAHAPSLDCAGMIVPGATVHMTANAPGKKTSHAIQVALEPREDGTYASVGAHPRCAAGGFRV